MWLRVLLLLPTLALGPVSARIDAPPLTPSRVVARFRAPANAFATGHRGVDLAAGLGQAVVSPISGVVDFSGTVAGRPVVTVSDGRRTVTLEPVESGFAAGTLVRAGQRLGHVGWGGHCSLRCVHLGLRIDGNYVEPLGLRPRLVP